MGVQLCNQKFDKFSVFRKDIRRIYYGNLSRHCGGDVLCPTHQRIYAVSMKAISMNIIKTLPLISFFFLGVAPNKAALNPISPSDFATGAVVLDFSALANFTEANGLALGGVLFQVTKNSAPTNGIVAIDNGPGITGNVAPPNLVSIADIDGVAVVVSLPNLTTQFGYGYAIRVEDSVPSATTINLFAGQTPIGSISFTGTPDPQFAGGFAGVASDSPFDRAVIEFSDAGDAFALDNVTFVNGVSEQGATVILLPIGLCVLLCLRLGYRTQLEHH